jgi:RNA polymerase sigma factor for flagellar operon FliA
VNANNPVGVTKANETERRVTQATPLVHQIAQHLLMRLPPSVQYEDLVQAGMVGLVEAARHFQPREQGARFETYAGIRIRGAMLDELRHADWTPRSVHRKAREAAAAIRSIEAREGRDARDAEVAAHLGISLKDYLEILRDSLYCRLFSVEELLESGDAVLESCSDPAATPIEGLARASFAKALADAISGLPERERLVVRLYYEEEHTLKVIGQTLGVTESRVCQIHSQAMLRLRARMHDWGDPETAVSPKPRRGKA